MEEYQISELFNDSQRLANALNIHYDMSASVLTNQSKALELFDKIQKRQIEMVWIGDKNYPNRLRNFAKNDMPPVLFCQGNLNLLKNMSVGFCGSRKSSEKGLSITKQCVIQLIEKEIDIVSGYAAGVDITSHQSALEFGGNTIIVLAEGLFKSSQKREIKPFLSHDNYLFISQFLPDMTWNSHNAMRRNSTILGLSDAMILVESGITGGTFQAGQTALKTDKPLFVIDFSNTEQSSEANPYFIERGAIPIRKSKTSSTPNLSKLFDTLELKSQEIQENQNLLEFVTTQ
ncbi:MAG: DNA-protecting protein DprA [Planctomycetaceae bacterium]|nr:DNA-protecting protein DprA [Planctomycetaceae bacterium]